MSSNATKVTQQQKVLILYNKSTFVFQVCLLVNKATDVYTALREREQTNYPTSKAWQRRVKGKKNLGEKTRKNLEHII